ncbi:MAG TPA: tyrosine-type recombinase/integrase, partial [Vicinamibacterales bacterium]|nr:tyrosine-type recombinase/integrase [Vicinamibacterales bacterium]
MEEPLVSEQLMTEMRAALRARHYSRRTEQVSASTQTQALCALDGDKWQMASLMYDSGPRLMECLRLRILDLEFTRGEIVVRDGKGGKDRVTVLPRTLTSALGVHLAAARAVHRFDRAAGWGRVELPDALARKYPDAPAGWRWQWVFPQRRRWTNP